MCTRGKMLGTLIRVRGCWSWVPTYSITNTPPFSYLHYFLCLSKTWYKTIKVKWYCHLCHFNVANLTMAATSLSRNKSPKVLFPHNDKSPSKRGSFLLLKSVDWRNGNAKKDKHQVSWNNNKSFWGGLVKKFARLYKSFHTFKVVIAHSDDK